MGSTFFFRLGKVGNCTQYTQKIICQYPYYAKQSNRHYMFQKKEQKKGKRNSGHNGWKWCGPNLEKSWKQVKYVEAPH